MDLLTFIATCAGKLRDMLKLRLVYFTSWETCSGISWQEQLLLTLRWFGLVHSSSLIISLVALTVSGREQR